MKTPIYDFAREYANSSPARFHMPGHKGIGALGVEKYDLTEIVGADELYSPSGIIRESEENATALFKTAHTFYLTEGSTLGIKAMLALATEGIKSPRILAARASHKALIYAAALLDIDVSWIYPSSGWHMASQIISPESIREALASDSSISAVYITSPDYLGNVADIKGISLVCREFSVPLLVDNAHGAYLAFLADSLHPIALGADMCCDSAHKTLPVLTGGAYLHISKNAERYLDSARSALSLFASTSPSYLILESLDLCNSYIASGYREMLSKTLLRAELTKQDILALGYSVLPSEPLKIVIKTTDYGYTGGQIAEILMQNGIFVEFFDSEVLVLMLTPENSDGDYERLVAALKDIPKKSPVKLPEYSICKPQKVLSIRQALLSKSETVSVSDAIGRIAGAPAVSCPPAIALAVSGELIDGALVAELQKRKIETIEVVKNA